jgi:hypothetical protein
VKYGEEEAMFEPCCTPNFVPRPLGFELPDRLAITRGVI